MKKSYHYFTAIITFMILTASCGSTQQKNNEEAQVQEPVVYTAELNSINENITGQPVSGTLTITVQGDSATIELVASSLAPGMMHLAHLHGNEDGSEASCPGFPEADTNNDSIVDLIETQEYSGVTMIPFHDNPVSMQIKTETYPKADAQGNLNYSKVISLQELSSAVQENFGVEELNFENFVVFVHGVAEQTALPESVQSLPDVPAMVTLPVACGELE